MGAFFRGSGFPCLEVLARKIAQTPFGVNYSYRDWQTSPFVCGIKLESHSRTIRAEIKLPFRNRFKKASTRPFFLIKIKKRLCNRDFSLSGKLPMKIPSQPDYLVFPISASHHSDKYTYREWEKDFIKYLASSSFSTWQQRKEAQESFRHPSIPRYPPQSFKPFHLNDNSGSGPSCK